MQRLTPEQIQMLLGQLQQRFGPAPGADAPAGEGQQAPPNLRGQIPQKGSGQRGAWNRMVEGMRKDQFMSGMPKQPSATEAVAGARPEQALPESPANAIGNAAPPSLSPEQVSDVMASLNSLGRSPIQDYAAGGRSTLQQFPAGDTQNVDIARSLAERLQPGSGRAAFDAPGFNIANTPGMQLGLENQGAIADMVSGLQGQKIPYAKPIIPKANSAGNTRVSPGVYRNAQGQTIKSKTGR